MHSAAGMILNFRRIRHSPAACSERHRLLRRDGASNIDGAIARLSPRKLPDASALRDMTVKRLEEADCSRSNADFRTDDRYFIGLFAESY